MPLVLGKGLAPCYEIFNISLMCFAKFIIKTLEDLSVSIKIYVILLKLCDSRP